MSFDFKSKMILSHLLPMNKKLECKDTRNIPKCGKRSGNTAWNTVISPNFLLWKVCGKTQFPHSFRRFAQNYAETVPFHKISILGN